MPASSRASRTGGAAGGERLVVGRVRIDVLGIDLAAGEHPHAAEGVLGVAVHHQHLDLAALAVTDDDDGGGG